MKKFLLTTGLALGIFALPLLGSSLAQEYDEMEDIGRFSYGQVASISADKLVVSEYDYDSEEYVEVVYVINKETVFKNVGSAAEIKVGDEVEVNYTEADDQNIATVIAKDLPWPPEADESDSE